MAIFTRLFDIECPDALRLEPDGRHPAFPLRFGADGRIPFPQIILRTPGREVLLNGDDLQGRPGEDGGWVYQAQVPAAAVTGPRMQVQIEGCRRADIAGAGGDDWIKRHREIHLTPPVRASADRLAHDQARDDPTAADQGTLGLGSDLEPKPVPAVTAAGDTVKLYFGIHKHMHQPYYDTTDRLAWDGEKDGIFGARGGNYTDFIPAAVQRYIDGGLPHAGLSTSWSGSLIEQLDRCAELGRCSGRFAGWNRALREMAGARTALGNPRIAFAGLGFYHPLMPLIPPRDIVRQIEWHRRAIRDTFGVEASGVLFPPETAFHVRMIPALRQAGVSAVIYDSIHRFRACRDYPYAGIGEGMLPPNPADQVNPPMDDWLQLHNIWAGSPISPSLLRPEYVGYEDPSGAMHSLIAIPAERYIGNEDARGGFGALQYPDVLGQVYRRIVDSGRFDPAHPPFFLLHSDGDNHGGGADSYYHHNTDALVHWLRQDPRFELTTAEDYLQRFPPDPAQVVHIEPGAWAGADNGDPQFMKWFSRYDQPYSPDLNSWAVLTALQNRVHTLEDAEPDHPALAEAIRLLLTAETSCYWYWTGQQQWDEQVTRAANLALAQIGPALDGLVARGGDRTAPTIFPPWVTPENPGGKRWGQGCLLDAPRQALVHAFVDDCAGLRRVDLVLRGSDGEQRLPMRRHGPYPSATGARASAEYLTAELPAGAGDLRYFIEAEDGHGNLATGSLERIFLA
ncbi:glycosyl hydrolase family 57 [Thiohalocapsa marina]|uniref:Glycosyl hydrolase family 57 n=1 Tax=Thiohalocapsa marina TaxID=424902 RepID=A0A5M8FK71_9GAMM|nr:glycosyl hydrolase family 57 [Thiohalocapsa marina]KAA6184390.1 glycosyl hydrolase family 57 [Thiohalocapsa marina]